jgi:hypothetical protein
MDERKRKVNWIQGKLFVLVTMIGMAAPLAYGESYTIKTEKTPELARLEILFKNSISLPIAKEDKQEILLQFDRAVEPPSLDAITAGMSDWIGWMNSGYDTLLIHTVRDVKFTVSMPSAECVAIQMVPLDTAKEDGDAAVRLAILKSKLLSSTGHRRQAMSILKELRRSHPTDIQVLAALADLEYQNNRWRRAAGFYSKALAIQPENEDLQEARRDVLRPYEPSISYEGSYKDARPGQVELLMAAALEYPLALPTRLRLIAEQDRYRYSTGSGVEDKIGVRNRLTASLQHDFSSSAQVGLALYSNEHRLGGSGSFRSPIPWGSIQFDAAYNKPYWDILNAVENYATRDRASIEITNRILSRAVFKAGGAVNRYRVNRELAARTYSYNALLAYTLVRRRPIIELEYITDAEKYLDSVRSILLPLTNRNVHSAGITTSISIGSRTQLIGNGGFSIDINGGQGPFAAVHLQNNFTKRLSCDLWAERRQNSIVTSQVVTTVGVKIAFRLKEPK